LSFLYEATMASWASAKLSGFTPDQIKSHRQVALGG
jgi:hypothetical protein